MQPPYLRTSPTVGLERPALMNPVLRMKAPSCCGIPVQGANTVPGFARWRPTRRERPHLLSQRHRQASSRSTRMGATASSIRGFTSAIRAFHDLQWIPPAVTALHKRIAAGGGVSAGPRPYLPAAGLIILVENATKSRYGASLGLLQPLPRCAFYVSGRWPLSAWRTSRFRGLSSSGIAKLGTRGTPPDPCRGARTKYKSGPMALCWEVTRSLTCWFGKHVSRAWPTALLARHTPGRGGTPSTGVARGRAGPTNPTWPTSNGGGGGRALRLLYSLPPVGLIRRPSPPPSSPPRSEVQAPARSLRKWVSPQSRAGPCIPSRPKWWTRRPGGKA